MKHVEDNHDKEPTQIKCPICSYSNISEHDVTKHVEDSHDKPPTQIKCPLCSYNNISEHNMRKHVEDQHKEQHPCNKCNTQLDSQDQLRTHVENVHEKSAPPSSPPTPRIRPVVNIEDPETDIDLSPKHGWTLLIGDSHVKSLKTRTIEKALNQKGNRLRNPAYNKPKDGSAYTTTRFWPKAKYPENNLENKLPELLHERPYNSAIVLTPSNNITNIEDQPKEEQNKLAVATSTETLAMVEKALDDFPTLKKVLIVELPPRADNERLSELVEFANFVLKSAVEKSRHRDQISVVSLNPLYDQSQYDIFGSFSSPKSDGIHMRGRRGSRLYTDCILNGVKSAGLGSTATPPKAASYNIPTSNLYEVLSN